MNTSIESIRGPGGLTQPPRTLLTILLSCLVCGLPLALLIDFRSTFYVDWFNHLWLIEYFGEYFKRNGSFPQALMTTNVIGISTPIFYGGKFYALTGLLSAWIGSALAFRIVAFAVLVGQFWHVERAVRSASGQRFLSFVVATIVSWAIYPLTNLYNRSALTEFVAVAFLTWATANLLVLSSQLAAGKRSYYDAVSFGLMYTAAALTHPLTALFGCTFLVPIGLGALLTLRRGWLIGVGFFNLIMNAAVLGSWYYVVHRFGHALPVSDSERITTSFRSVGFFPDSIDNVWSRLSPVPVDFRSISKGIEVATPYLDAQVSFPLVFLTLALAWFWLKPFTDHVESFHGSCQPRQPLLLVFLFLSAGLFIFFFALSVDPDISALFGGFFDVLQFPYRLTTYVNLTLMISVFSLGGLVTREVSGEENIELNAKTLVLAACLTISAIALVTKLIHADAIRFDEPFRNIDKLNKELGLQSWPDPAKSWYPGMPSPGARLIKLLTTFYGYGAYVVGTGFSTTRPAGSYAEQAIAFVPDDSRRFGKVPRLTVEVPTATLIVTNIEVFPWNALIVDKVREPDDKIYVTESGAFAEWTKPVVEAVLVPPGKHVLEYRFIPDRVWYILERVSWVVLLAWIILWILVTFLCRRMENKS